MTPVDPTALPALLGEVEKRHVRTRSGICAECIALTDWPCSAFRLAACCRDLMTANEALQKQDGQWVVESYGLGHRDAQQPRHIVVQARVQRDNVVLWAVSDGFAVLNKHGDWEHERIPSSRDDDFLARCRWSSADAAKAAALAALTPPEAK